jgi:competence protein ComEA
MNQWLENHKTLVLAGTGLAIVAALIFNALRWREPAPITIEPPAATVTNGPIQVYISGAVVKPDVYSLPDTSIVRDAIDAAGGPAADADLNRINLAQQLANGQQVYVPRIGEIPTSVPMGDDTSSGQPALAGPININTATAAELETLPRIGPALAERIVQYRDDHGPFLNIEAIMNVTGIGPSIFEEIKDLITVG